MLPSPSDLKYFLELYKTQNLSRAAERLGITQPSLSLSLKRLEENLKIKLFIRTKAGTTATHAADLFYKDIQKLLDQWDRIGIQVKETTEIVKGNFRIGCHTSVANYAISPWLKPLCFKYPDLEFNFIHDLSRNILEQIIIHNIDIGLIINPKRHPDLVITKLLNDSVTLRYLKSKTTLTDTLIYDPNLMQSQNLLLQIKKKKISFKKFITSSSLELIHQMTLSGLGVGILPGQISDPKLQEFQPSIKPFEDELCLVYRADRLRTASFESIVDEIKAKLKI